jgi:mevalonate pyrophosphate decarboxylase
MLKNCLAEDLVPDAEKFIKYVHYGTIPLPVVLFEKLSSKDLRAFENSVGCKIMVFSEIEKKIPSTEGMNMCVEKSELLKSRVRFTPQNITGMISAIFRGEKDVFYEMMMRDSDNFHMIVEDCLGPENSYLSMESKRLMLKLNSLRNRDKEEKEEDKGGLIGYTFDAGPNPTIYYEKGSSGEQIFEQLCDWQKENGMQEGFIRGLKD